jgi:hypothetical protein
MMLAQKPQSQSQWKPLKQNSQLSIDAYIRTHVFLSTPLLLKRSHASGVHFHAPPTTMCIVAVKEGKKTPTRLKKKGQKRLQI